MLPDRLRNALARMGRAPRAYQDVFASPAGEIVLRDLARVTGVLEVGTVPGDAIMSAFNDGRRAVFLHVARQLRWTEAQVLAMARQAADGAVADAMEAEDA